MFGDGSVLLFSTPGHTGGHQSLLVHLQKTGWVLLTGDTVQIKDQWDRLQSSPGSIDERLAPSMRRLAEIAAKYKAQVWFSHDPVQTEQLRAAGKFLE